MFKRLAMTEFDSDSDTSCEQEMKSNENGEDSEEEAAANVKPKEDDKGYTVLMRNKIDSLPLPQPLKLYLNYQRHF